MKLIIKWEQKGWFKGLGLHHMAVTAVAIAIAVAFGFGGYGAVGMLFWYARQETLSYPVIEYMDFISPAVLIFILFYFNFI